MRRIKKGNFIKEEYRDIDELLHNCLTREKTEAFSSVDSMNNPLNGWFGGSWDDCVQWLKYGKEQNVEEFKKQIDHITSNYKKTSVRPYNDYVGYAPNVPNLVMGLPKTMINQKRYPKKTKILSVFIDVTRSFLVKEEECVAFGSKLLGYIMKLEMSGYRVKIMAGASFGDKNEDRLYCVTFPIKNENQPLDLKRINFPLTNIGMLRRICFRWYETCPDAQNITGYGNPIYLLSPEKAARYEKFLCSDTDLIYLYHKCDFEKKFQKYQ
jgi:hypothetical protein